jgi:hypothetical protein
MIVIKNMRIDTLIMMEMREEICAGLWFYTVNDATVGRMTKKSKNSKYNRINEKNYFLCM